MSRRSPRRSWRVGLMLILGLGILLAGTIPASAAERRSGDGVTINSEEVITDDLYITGRTITINGTVKGDVLAAGGTITINGVVEGDVLAIGQSVEINGTVRDDARLVAAAIVFGPQARLGDDLLGGGGQIEQQFGASIAGDVYVGAGQARFAGSIAGDLQGGFEGLELRGPIGGNVDVAVGNASSPAVNPRFTFDQVSSLNVPPGLTVADSARIEGSLKYQAAREAAIGGNADNVLWTPLASPATATALDTPIAMARRFAVLLLIGLLLIALTPRWIRNVTTTVEARPLTSLGWGVVGLASSILLMFLIPLLAILLMVFFGWLSLGGLIGVTLVLAMTLLSGLITSFAILVSYLAQVIVGFIVGHWILARLQPRWAEGRVAPLVLGLALYVLLRAVPGLGPLVALVVVLFGIGACWQRVQAWRASRTGPAAPMMAAPTA